MEYIEMDWKICRLNESFVGRLCFGGKSWLGYVFDVWIECN